MHVQNTTFTKSSILCPRAMLHEIPNECICYLTNIAILAQHIQYNFSDHPRSKPWATLKPSAMFTPSSAKWRLPVQSWQSPTLQYNTVQYKTIQYSTVQYSTVQYITVSRFIQSTLWRGIAYVSIVLVIYFYKLAIMSMPIHLWGIAMLTQISGTKVSGILLPRTFTQLNS